MFHPSGMDTQPGADGLKKRLHTANEPIKGARWTMYKEKKKHMNCTGELLVMFIHDEFVKCKWKCHNSI